MMLRKIKDLLLLLLVYYSPSPGDRYSISYCETHQLMNYEIKKLKSLKRRDVPQLLFISIIHLILESTHMFESMNRTHTLDRV